MRHLPPTPSAPIDQPSTPTGHASSVNQLTSLKVHPQPKASFGTFPVLRGCLICRMAGLMTPAFQQMMDRLPIEYMAHQVGCPLRSFLTFDSRPCQHQQLFMGKAGFLHPENPTIDTFTGNPARVHPRFLPEGGASTVRKNGGKPSTNAAARQRSVVQRELPPALFLRGSPLGHPGHVLLHFSFPAGRGTHVDPHLVAIRNQSGSGPENGPRRQRFARRHHTSTPEKGPFLQGHTSRDTLFAR